MTLHLHIGAHKTATTHLQATLIRHQARLAEAGVHLERPDAVRALIKAGRGASATMGPFPSFRRTAAARRLAGLDRGAKRMVISDENSLGSCAEIFDRMLLYPTARRRLQICRRLCDQRGAIVYLSVRNYAHFLSAAYVQAIRNSSVFTPDDLSIAALAQLPRRWTDIAQDVRRALPNARLRVWAFEDYDALSPRLYREMTGLALSPVGRRPMATPSADAISAFRAAPRHNRPKLQKFFEDHPITASNPKFSLWSQDQTAALGSLYAEDLARLRSDLGEDFLSP